MMSTRPVSTTMMLHTPGASSSSTISQDSPNVLRRTETISTSLRQGTESSRSSQHGSTPTVPSLAERNITPNPDLHFKPVLGEGREGRHELVRNFFNTTLQRIYGSQASALAKIAAQPSDRTCRLLYDARTPVGLIVVKKALTNEFFPDSLEIKTLAVLDTARSGRGYGSALLNKIEEIATQLKANSMHVTINSSVPESLAFFKKKGFVEARVIPHLGQQGTRESLLVKMMAKGSVSAERTLGKNVTTSTTDETAHDGREEQAQAQGTKRKSPERPITSERRSSTNTTVDRTPVNQAHSTTASQTQSTARSAFDHRSSTPAYPSTNQRTFYAAQRTFSNSGSRTGRPLEATLKNQYVAMINNGTKTTEVRIHAGMFHNLKIGHTIRFFCGGRQPDEVTCEITKLNIYKSFEDMLTQEGYKSCLPDASSLESAIRTYHNIPSFTERARKSGVVAIHIKKVS